jgi:hypothetical protein
MHPKAFYLLAQLRAFFLRFFLGLSTSKVRGDFPGSREATTPRTIFFYWRRGAQHHMRFFFLRRARKRPRTTCGFFLGNTGAQLAARRWRRRPQTGLP